MRKKFLRLGALCLMLMLAFVAKAQNVTAMWDFENDLPQGICSATNYEGVTVDIPSTVEGIVMHVDATNGKLNCVGRNNAQMNPGTVLQVPVTSTRDIVTVKGYPGYNHYAIGGVEATEDVTSHRALAAEVAQGYVEITATAGNNYIYSVQVEYVSSLQEKSIYKTDFSEWTETSATKQERTVEWKTKYSGETLTFTLFNTSVKNVTDTKFANTVGVPHIALIAEKDAANAANPYVTTSVLGNVSRVRFLHGATGGNRGWKLEAKGDGDADWVVISDAIANPAGGQEVVCDVNKDNCQLRFTNLNIEQNAYLFELEIYSVVDLSAAPILGSFKLNGEEYVAGDIFEDVDDTKATATILIPSADPQVSETNPLTDITVENGELGTVTYALDGTTTVVTMPVIFGNQTKNYELTVGLLPMLNVNYHDTDGTLIGTQEVEQYSKIGTLKYGVDDVTVADGKKFRGWFVSATGGRKIDAEEVVEEELDVYAVATNIETTESKASHYYNLRDQYFYAEDHEAFNPTGGSWHDTTHGWAFSAGDKIDILVSGNADIMLGTCLYSSESDITVDAQTVAAKAATDGELKTVRYEGAPGTVTITFGGTTYLHSLAIVNEGSVTNGYYIVEKDNADDFLTALNIANATSEGNGYKIFLPNGTYDLGEKTLNTVSANNVSIIGQSMEGTVIKNAPLVENEGIGTTATIYNTSTGLYLQDLTLQNALDYYGSGAAGRAVCLQDKGANTIAKNVKMLSYQDTYYSNKTSNFYWEDSEIHGTVDYLCGDGEVVFNRCKFVNESRSATSRSGDCTIAAPNMASSIKWGYVMLDCNIVTNSSSFNFGRSWGGNSTLAYIRTTLEEPSRLASSRFTVSGMNCAAQNFKEYKTMDASGNVISPETNVMKFTHSTGNTEYETILSEAEAAKYTLENIYGDWAPDAVAAQKTMGEVAFADGVISWNAVEGSDAYAIFCNDELVAITETTSYAVPTASTYTEYTVRAANGRGGFGKGQSVVTGISSIASDADVVRTEFYSVDGMRLAEPMKGVNIRVKRTSEGKTVTDKIVIR